MTCGTRRWVFLAFVVVLIAFPLEALLVRVFWGERIGAASAARWVTVHAQSLPTSVVDVKALPFEYRKAVMSALPPASRSRLWQTHIDGYLQREDVTPDQADVLVAFRQIMTPENLAGPVSPEVLASASALSQRAKRAFDDNQFTEIFLLFGPRRTLSSASAGAVLTLVQSLQAVVLAREVDCSCATTWNDGLCNTNPEAPTDRCMKRATDCTVDDWWPMCGFGWLYECDGRCWSELVTRP